MQQFERWVVEDFDSALASRQVEQVSRIIPAYLVDLYIISLC